jgi:para-aminobenzoate synthetase component I
MPLKYTRDLPYSDDSAAFMRALHRFAMPAFLDSARHGGKNGAMDILAAQPVAYICIENGKLTHSDNLHQELATGISSREIFSNIRKLNDLFLAPQEYSAELLSSQLFTGAVIAQLGYPTLAGKSELQLGDAFIAVYLWAIVQDHEMAECSLQFHPSCSEAFMQHTASAIDAALDATRDAGNESSSAGYKLLSAFQNQTSYAQYQVAFDQIKHRLASGDCYQVNLTQCFKARGQGHPLDAYLALRNTTAAPFSAYMNWGSGALLSLSPERFLRVSDGKVVTQPIKGTRPRGKTAVSDRQLAAELALSEKDKAENLMIVDLLRNDIGRVCATGSIEVNQLFEVESFSNVHHLVSTVSGTLRPEQDAIDLLASCYPGGSITGAPKLSAMHIIQQLETSARRVYCGTAFYLGSAGNFDSSITIRSLLWQPEQLLCWAGGGIVADSDCAQEYQECFDKVSNILGAFKA